jgi:DNA-binding transcriptional LysR family regulator
MALLGQMLMTGYGCKVDTKEGQRWSQQAKQLLLANQEAEAAAAKAAEQSNGGA